MTTHLLQWLNFKNLIMPIANKDAELQKLSFIVGGDAEWYSHFRYSLAVYYKAKCSVIMSSSDCAHRHLFNWFEKSMSTEKHVHKYLEHIYS